MFTTEQISLYVLRATQLATARKARPGRIRISETVSCGKEAPGSVSSESGLAPQVAAALP